MSRAIRIAASVLALLSVGACSSEGGTRSQRERSNITSLPQPTTGPYVSVAVDNHFHDIHPADGITIAGDRPFVVENGGHNLHNVSVAGTDISHDIRPGDRFALRPVGKYLEPGTYQIFCKYHADQGMVGEITVAP